MDASKVSGTDIVDAISKCPYRLTDLEMDNAVGAHHCRYMIQEGIPEQQ